MNLDELKTYTDFDEIIAEMYNGNMNAIMQCAKSNSSILQVNSIICGVKIGLKSNEYIGLIQNVFMRSKAKFFGMSMTYFAEAALDILGIKPYTGDDSTVLMLINSKMDF